MIHSTFPNFDASLTVSVSSSLLYTAKRDLEALLTTYQGWTDPVSCDLRNRCEALLGGWEIETTLIDRKRELHRKLMAIEMDGHPFAQGLFDWLLALPVLHDEGQRETFELLQQTARQAGGALKTIRLVGSGLERMREKLGAFQNQLQNRPEEVAERSRRAREEGLSLQMRSFQDLEEAEEELSKLGLLGQSSCDGAIERLDAQNRALQGKILSLEKSLDLNLAISSANEQRIRELKAKSGE